MRIASEFLYFLFDMHEFIKILRMRKIILGKSHQFILIIIPKIRITLKTYIIN